MGDVIDFPAKQRTKRKPERGTVDWERVAEYFAARTDVHVLPASRTLREYIEWCKRIGLPHERTATAQSKVVKEIKRDRGAETGRIAWLRHHYPDQYRLLEAEFPSIRQLR